MVAGLTRVPGAARRPPELRRAGAVSPQRVERGQRGRAKTPSVAAFDEVSNVASPLRAADRDQLCCAARVFNGDVVSLARSNGTRGRCSAGPPDRGPGQARPVRVQTPRPGSAPAVFVIGETLNRCADNLSPVGEEGRTESFRAVVCCVESRTKRKSRVVGARKNGAVSGRGSRPHPLRAALDLSNGSWGNPEVLVTNEHRDRIPP
jgi:hypothetical protein